MKHTSNDLAVDAYVFLADLLEEIRDHGEGGAIDSYRPGEFESGIRLVAGVIGARLTPEQFKAAGSRLW